MVAPPEVQVILPCLDEVGALPWVLSRVPVGYGALVVDNGSTDGSARVARDHGAIVVSATERGYGAACHAGLLAATAAVVVVMDCDASLDPSQLARVVDPVRQGRVDLMVGTRKPLSRGAFPWHLRVANRVIVRRIRQRTGVSLRDLGPVRAAGRQALLGLCIADRRSGYPVETVFRAVAAGWRIGQIEVDYSPRHGRSKVSGTPLGALRAVRDISAVLTGPVAELPR
jgi:glycosyltransferase involved in cell wall biosynthesis